MSKIIYAKSSNSGAPSVNNSWGAITTLLQTVLVEGYLVSAITSSTASSDLIRITCAIKHGLTEYQTVAISTATEATDSTLVYVFKVIDEYSFFIKKGNITTVDFQQGTVRVPPLGWDVLYNLDNRAVFKPNSKEGPNHPVFVSNRVPYTGYTAVKFANFGLAEQYWTDFEPKGLTAPPVWSTLSPSGTGTTMQYGFNRIFYNVSSAWNWESASSSTSVEQGACDWTLIGDESYFYLHLKVSPTKDNYILFGAGSYDSFVEGYTYNSFVAGCLFNDTASSSVNSLDYAGLFSNDAHLKTLSGLSDISVKTLTVHSYMNMNLSGGSNVLSNTSAYTHLFKACLKDASNQLTGSLKGLCWIANAVPFKSFRVFNQGTGLYLPLPVIYKGSSGQVAIKVGDINES